jgi:uncharacterized protein
MQRKLNRRAGLVVCLLAVVWPAAGAEPRLIAAVRSGDAKGVESLLEQGLDVNQPQGDGATALHFAVYRDDLGIIQRLIAAGANLNAADDLGVVPLALACLNGSAEVVEMLLMAGADPNRARTNGETPLMTASRVGNARVVKTLIESGAKLDARENAHTQTALMFAVAEGHREVVEVLLDAGAHVNARSKTGFTSILFAAQQGDAAIARILLAFGANVNDSAPDGIGGDTNAKSLYKPGTEAAVLLVAIDSGHSELAKLLLDQGADPNHRGAGRTALHSAVQRAQPETVIALLAHGAEKNARLEKPLPAMSRAILQDTGLDIVTLGATPFWLASSYCDLRIMHILADAGADTTLTSNDHTTPLMVAAGVDFVDGQDKYGRRWYGEGTEPLQIAARDAVELCLQLGGDINAANDKGQTALHGAVYFGGTTLVQYMVDRGARINVVNARGQTPWLITQGEYHSGSFYVHKETGELLVTLGADTQLGADLGHDFARKKRAGE